MSRFTTDEAIQAPRGQGDTYDGGELETYDCQRCGGTGEINVCLDDLCAGSDDCIHGDGMVICGECDGSGIRRGVR